MVVTDFDRYTELRERLDDVTGREAKRIRDEMAKLWNKLSPDEQASVDTCPGCPVPFADAT